MDRDYWLQRWEQNQLGWHLADTNPLLARHWSALDVPAGAAVFVPLCGKSLDMRYLEAAGHPVVGVELSEDAVRAYFEEGDEQPDREERAPLTRYAGPRTTLYCGDFFDLRADDLADIRAVYDRGSLIALRPDLRARYAEHMLRIVPPHTEILLLTYEYDQDRVDGPPHAVPDSEVNALYGPRCRIATLERLARTDVPPHFPAAGVDSVTETVYRITRDR